MEAGSVAVIFSLRVGGPTYTKSCAIVLSTRGSKMYAVSCKASYVTFEYDSLNPRVLLNVIIGATGVKKRCKKSVSQMGGF